MAMLQQNSAVVGVFRDHSQAQKAVNELRRMGFTEEQIGVAQRDMEGRSVAGQTAELDDDTYAGEGTVAGLATGAGVGALWGLGIVAGILPAIGPAIAGGTLAAILSSAAAGAAAAGLGGALIGLGLTKEEAEYYNREFEEGRTVVTVNANGREDEVKHVLREYGAYDISQRIEGDSSTALHAGSGSSMSGLESRGSTSTSQSNTGSSSSSSVWSGNDVNSDENRLTAYDEELSVEKRVRSGNVNVYKEVETEHKTIDVPVQREELVIERRSPSGTGSGATGHQELRIPVSEEEVQVHKHPVAKEDVVVSKQKVQDTQRVNEELRKEKIRIDNDANVPVRDQRSS